MEIKRGRGRPGKNSGKLERSRIIRSAKDLTLSGKKVPSVRRLASELHVDPMAIYHYFSNKKALLEAVSVSLISGIYSPDKVLPWEENVMSLCKSYIALLLAYPDLVSVFLSMTTGSVAEVFCSRFEACVEELAISREETTTVTALLADYIHGFAFSAACNQTDTAVTVDLAEKPLSFIIGSIRNLQGAV